MSDIQKLLDSKHGIVQCYAVKGIINGDYTELIIKVNDTEIGRLWFNPRKKPNKDKKHTGGRPSYVKVYIQCIRDKRLNIDLSGALINLADNISWCSGLIVKTRTKKALQADEIFNLWQVAPQKGKQIIKKLKELNLLKHTSEGYFISPDFMQKGGVKRDTNKN